MVQFSKDDITSASGGSRDSGKTFVRTLFFTHDQSDTMVDVINSAYMPKWNDCHPVYTAFFVTDIGEVQVLSDIEWYIEVTYSNKIDSSEIVPAETPPWNLPPQNVSISTFDKEIAMTKYWSENKGKWLSLLTSAGTPITATKTVTVGVLSFTMNEKAKSSLPVLNAAYIYNAASETVCGIKIPAHCGKLLPFSSTLHSVTDSSTGSVKYEYWSIDVTIHFILPTGDQGNESWGFSYLDVSTLVRDDRGRLSAVYKFKKATQEDELLSAEVKYGTIEELMIQRAKWKSDKSDFPYEEITEPMPLRDDGTLDISRVNGEIDMSKELFYPTIDGFDSRPASWSRFNLPKRR